MNKNNLRMDTDIEDIPFSKYPRPGLKRDSFLCLNGKWNKVRVPFPLGSENSEIRKAKSFFIYEREFSLPKGFCKDKILLNFGAVDQLCAVYVNGTFVGKHEGGYIPFSFDITKCISRLPGAKNTLRVEITDKLSKLYPFGKQKKIPHGIWYTPVSGIWQSVWLESVNEGFIEGLEITPDLDRINLHIWSESHKFKIKIFDEGKLIFEKDTEVQDEEIPIENPVLWTPDNPHLYDIEISTPGDRVTSYFGLRRVEISEIKGIKRILLNGKPFFFNGVLDQGYYPEGIFLPNSEEEYKKDILRLKKLGINTIRKHIKIEPEIFYEACDRLGMLVFQDMVNNGSYKFFKHTLFPTLGKTKWNDMKNSVKEDVKNFYALSMEDTLKTLYNHPSVVYITLFNEGWGQFESDIFYAWAKTMDKTRIIDSTSGWFWQKKSDVDSYHFYFKPIDFSYTKRPVIISEFGGFSLKIKDHSLKKIFNFGYGKYKSKEELTKRIVCLYEEEILKNISKGLCGAVYTQAFDVESETNGLYTYDRKVLKVFEKEMKELSKKLTKEMEKACE